MIADIVLQTLKVSFFASLLIGPLLIMVPILQKRYRAKWRYIAWLAIALRLLIPLDLSLPEAPIHIELPATATVKMETQPASAESGAARIPQVELNNRDIVPDANVPDIAPYNIEPAPSTPAALTFSPMRVAGLIWLTGAIAFLLFQFGSYMVFLRRIGATRQEAAPESVKEAIQTIGADMEIRRLPEAAITTAIDAPVLVGVLRPRILLPHASYTDSALAYILRHELVHYRRRDMWYKLVLLAAHALHWFNPLVYLMTAQAARDIELACDDDVTRGLDGEARALYGDTILSALPKKRRLEPLFSTHFGSNQKNIKGRLRNLFDMSGKRRGIIALCAVVICAAIIASFATVGYAAESPREIINMELTESYDTSDPFIHANLFRVTENIATLRLDFTFQMRGGSGLLEIADNESNEVYWSKAWKGTVKPANFSVTLNSLNKDIDYVVRFTGTKISYAKITATCNNRSVEKLARPRASGESSQVIIPKQSVNTVVYEKAEIDYQRLNDAPNPYIRDVITNNTNKKIIDFKQGMLGYDKDGNPLKIAWFPLSYPLEHSHFYLSGTSGEVILPGATTPDVDGGWTLNADLDDPEAAKIAYALYSMKEIVFADGTVWENPDFDTWRKTYEGKKIDAETLEGYYPYVMEIEETKPASIPKVEQGAYNVFDEEAIRIVHFSGTWGDSINRLLPIMTSSGVDEVVLIYLDKHLFPNITPPQAAKQVEAVIQPALQYMTNEVREYAVNRIAEYT